jgi:hypothetical protein
MRATEIDNLRTRLSTCSRDRKGVDECLELIYPEHEFFSGVVHVHPKRLLFSALWQAVVTDKCLSQTLGAYILGHAVSWLAIGDL